MYRYRKYDRYSRYNDYDDDGDDEDTENEEEKDNGEEDEDLITEEEFSSEPLEDDAEVDTFITHRMFFCKTAPEEFPGYDELARLYAETGDEKYYFWILHFYERTMTEKCQAQMAENYLFSGLEDLKIAFSMGIYEALQKYDPDVGNHFMKYKEHEVKRALYDELPLLISGYTIQNDKQHRRVKKTMGVYKKNADLPYEERITALSEEIQLTEKHAKEILLAADLNSHMEPLTKPVTDSDGNEIEEEWVETLDPTPERQFILKAQAEALWGAFERLSLKERMMIAASCGFCVNCFGTIVLTKDDDGNTVPAKRRPMMNTDIAVIHQCTPKTVASTLKKAYKKLRGYLHETDYFADTDFEAVGKIENERYARRRIRAEERKRQEAEQKQKTKQKKPGRKKKELPEAV